MPGYEVYDSDGTLLTRCKRQDMLAITEDELRQMALAIAPASNPSLFIIDELDSFSYEQRKEDQAANGFPNKFGGHDSAAQWEAKILSKQGT